MANGSMIRMIASLLPNAEGKSVRHLSRLLSRLVCVTVLASCAGKAIPDDLAADASALVQAQVVSVQVEKDRVVGTLKITHVYAGSKTLLGTEFLADSSEDVGGSTEGAVRPAYKKDDFGVWLLSPPDLAKKRPQIGYRAGYGCRWPSRKGLDERYDQQEALAGLLEQLGALTADEQVIAWRGYCRNAVPEIARCAVVMTRTQELVFLRGLVEDPACSAMTRSVAEKQMGKETPTEELRTFAWDQGILVEAEILSVLRDKDEVRATLKAIHIYTGPKNMEGRELMARSSAGASFSNLVFPPYEKGDVGIWLVPPSAFTESKSLDRYMECFGYSWPARKSRHKRYDQMKALARVIEEISSKSANEQVLAWRAYSRSEVPEIARCAVLMTRHELLTFLRGVLADSTYPILARATADEQLCLELPKVWHSSQDRAKSVETLAQSAYDAFGWRTALGIIVPSWERGELDNRPLIGLLNGAILNEAYPFETKKECFRELSRIVEKTPRLGDYVFWVVALKMIQESKVPAVQVQAASWIRTLALPSGKAGPLIPMTAERIVGLKKAREEVKDAETAKILDEIMARNPPTK